MRVLRVLKSCFEPGTQAQGLKPISVHFAFGTTKVVPWYKGKGQTTPPEQHRLGWGTRQGLKPVLSKVPFIPGLKAGASTAVPRCGTTCAFLAV
jgi:hypothetical protein